jgi:hypothetical protein
VSLLLAITACSLGGALKQQQGQALVLLSRGQLLRVEEEHSAHFLGSDRAICPCHRLYPRKDASPKSQSCLHE